MRGGERGGTAWATVILPPALIKDEEWSSDYSIEFEIDD